MCDLPLRLPLQLRAGGGVVGQWVGRVVVLVGVKVAVGRGGRQLAGHTARTFGPGGGVSEGQLRTVGVQNLRLLRSGIGGHRQPDGEAQRCAEHGVKAKAAIRAAIDILMNKLDLGAGDLQRMILTGSFGSQLNVEAVVGLGMIPAVGLEVVETSANGAGFGAALFLDDDEFARGERIAAIAEQVDLDLDADFNRRYIEAMSLPEGRRE